MDRNPSQNLPVILLLIQGCTTESGKEVASEMRSCLSLSVCILFSHPRVLFGQSNDATISLKCPAWNLGSMGVSEI